jgi:hypothetical protein
MTWVFVSDIEVLRFAPPDTGPLWNVHHKIGMFITQIINRPSGVIVKMDKADSTFPRAFLALFFAVHITNREEKFVVLTRL